VLLRFDLVNAGLTIVVLNDKTYYWVWIAPDEQLSFKTTKLEPSSAAWVGFA
jgi:hypothetical protein